MNDKQPERPKADERIRIRRYAIEQITQKGAMVEDVAKAPGYRQSTVISWVQDYSQGGISDRRFVSGHLDAPPGFRSKARSVTCENEIRFHR